MNLRQPVFKGIELALFLVFAECRICFGDPHLFENPLFVFIQILQVLFPDLGCGENWGAGRATGGGAVGGAGLFNSASSRFRRSICNIFSCRLISVSSAPNSNSYTHGDT